jgi:hypothetical protein
MILLHAQVRLVKIFWCKWFHIISSYHFPVHILNLQQNFFVCKSFQKAVGIVKETGRNWLLECGNIWFGKQIGKTAKLLMTTFASCSTCYYFDE